MCRNHTDFPVVGGGGGSGLAGQCRLLLLLLVVASLSKPAELESRHALSLPLLLLAVCLVRAM